MMEVDYEDGDAMAGVALPVLGKKSCKTKLCLLEVDKTELRNEPN
jgi:hypothetical protein